MSTNNRPTNALLVTQLPADVSPAVRQCLQGMAQAIDQLTRTARSITAGSGPSMVMRNGKAASFNGVFLVGTIAAANTPQVFNHQLGRTPLGAIEILALPQATQATVPVAQVASAIALLKSSNNQLTLTSTAANRQFTLILL